MAVADVDRAGIDQDAVRPGARGRDDDVVAAQVERLDRVRIQREQRPERPRRGPQPLQERGLRGAGGEPSLGAALVVDGGVDVGLRPRVADRGEHALGAPEIEQKVVDKRNTPHRAPSYVADAAHPPASPCPDLRRGPRRADAARRQVPQGWLGVVVDGPLLDPVVRRRRRVGQPGRAAAPSRSAPRSTGTRSSPPAPPTPNFAATDAVVLAAARAGSACCRCCTMARRTGRR